MESDSKITLPEAVELVPVGRSKFYQAAEGIISTNILPKTGYFQTK